MDDNKFNYNKIDNFRMHEILFEHAHDIILYIKLEGQIVNANERACEQYGYTKEELLLMKIQDIRHPSTVSQYEYQMQMADEEGITFDCSHMRKDGSNFPVEVSAKTISTENGRFRIHIIRDITARIKSQERIAWLANYDPLTEIPNRANFMLRLDEEILRSMRSKIPFAVMLFDIDKFKQFNDRYGHETGDFVLKHVALTVQSILRASDMVARFGGDEFVVIQTGINGRGEVEALASRMLESVAKTVSYKSMTNNIGISIGISMFPSDALEARALTHCADIAMYKAKRNGGASYCFFTPCDPPCLENRLCLDCDR